MAENYNAVDFSGLSATSDGNTLLYADNQVCKSDKTLGQLIDGKIDDKGYASETFVTGEINELSGTVSTEYATKEELSVVGNFIVTGADAQGKPDLDPTSAQTKSIYLLYNDSVTGSDQYKEWIVTENEQEEKVWTCIGDTTMNLSDYALSADVNDELSLKEDKIFVAEYNVTTYDDIKTAYDAGKKIICKYQVNLAQLAYAQLSQFIAVANTFVFINTLSTQTIQIECKKQEEQTVWAEPVFSHFYDTTATSGSQQIQDALSLKEDKVFVAEYNVTTYADIKTAYDAGKQIVCKYYEDKERWPEFVRLLRLSQYLPMGNCFYFDALTNDNSNIYVSCGYYNDDTHWTYSNNSFYNKTETSGSQQLDDAFNTKQDKLTFAGENNTITAINTSAVGGGTSIEAGTDLVINNGVISVNTNGTAYGTYAFVEGQNTQANGYASHAEGGNTRTYGTFAHAEGQSTSAVMGAHSEGFNTTASGNFSHAEGLDNITLNDGSHAEGRYTSAINAYSHSEGFSTLANGEASHAGGFYTNANDNYMTVIGKYNYTDSNAAFVVGNGEYNNNHDAFIVDWNGVASATKLATRGIQDVETKITNIETTIGNIETILQSI